MTLFEHGRPQLGEADHACGTYSTPRLVLWDIDHTLIDVSGVSQCVYATAFQKATGLPMEAPWQLDGRTELASITEALRAHGLNCDGELVDTLGKALATEMRNCAEAMAAEGQVLPGAIDALTALSAVRGVHQSVLTGNLYPVAVVKLSAFDLAGYVDFRLGAYGEDAMERTGLPARAFERTRRHLGRRLNGADTVLIGDTLRDIATARAAGARIIAVATGTYSVLELRAAGADLVLPDLTDIDVILDAVAGSRFIDPR